MKKKIDLYEISKTMSGRERFMLEFEGMKESELKDEDCVPKICTIFHNKKDLAEYRAMNLDQAVINLCLSRLASNIHAIILFMISLRRRMSEDGNDEKDNKLFLLQILDKMAEFDQLYKLIDEINDLHDVDLLMPSARTSLDDAKDDIYERWVMFSKCYEEAVERKKLTIKPDDSSKVLRKILYEVANTNFNYEL